MCNVLSNFQRMIVALHRIKVIETGLTRRLIKQMEGAAKQVIGSAVILDTGRAAAVTQVRLI